MILYAAMFLCNIAAGKLVATGAFEIYSGSGELLFSKINTGMLCARNLPNPNNFPSHKNTPPPTRSIDLVQANCPTESSFCR